MESKVKIRCRCKCHQKGSTLKHFTACCNNGYIEYPKLGYLNKGVFKDPKEPFESWFNRKIESMVGGTDEQGANRKEGVQNPKPLTSFKSK